MLEGREDLEYHEKVDWEVMNARIADERKKGFLSRYPQIAIRPVTQQRYPYPDHIIEEGKRRALARDVVVLKKLRSGRARGELGKNEVNTKWDAVRTGVLATITAGLIYVGEQLNMRNVAPDTYMFLGLTATGLTAISALVWSKKADSKHQLKRSPQKNFIDY